MQLFYRDIANKPGMSWENLIADLNQTLTYNTYCHTADCYTVFKHILLSLYVGEEIILLDADFTKEELIKLTGFSKFEAFSKPIQKEIKIQSYSDLIDGISMPDSNRKITLFTSGTTGLPKKVSHSFESISRFVKKTNTANVWGFAYPPTHMAGLQVFFQAFLNSNPIVDLTGLQQPEILNEIKETGITHISATPTFFRLLLPIKGTYPSVKKITSGGEKFDINTMEALQQAFPNASFRNVYASTEAGSLLAAAGDVFTIKPGMQTWMKIEQGELFIHQSLMGETYLNASEWYATGDLVDILDTNPIKFRFLSRKNEMINVGGYKVNPQEVEAAIREIPGIADVMVYAKTNSVMGNILCCKAIKTNPLLEEAGIRLLLQSRLQEYKIPRMIVFVDKLALTSSGKRKRK